MKDNSILVVFCIVFSLVSCTALERMPANPLDVEALEVVTSDGIRLSLRNIIPKRELIKYPLLLIPDFFLSSDTFFLGPSGGLANYLAERGFEVWTLDLRGQGRSFAIFKYTAENYDWCFEDWLDIDIPLALSEITKSSGKEKVIIIGHGLGGTLALLAGAKYSEQIEAVVGLGSPGNLWHPPNKLIRAVLEHKDKIPSYPIKIQDYLDMPPPFRSNYGFWDILLFNDSGFEREQAVDFFSKRTNSVSPCVLKELASWYESGRLLDRDGRRDLLESLGSFNRPVLLIAGKLDNLYCPGEVLIAYDSVSSEDKEFFIASKINGLAADYGHMGLLIGPYADRDIYRYVLRWLQRRFARL